MTEHCVEVEIAPTSQEIECPGCGHVYSALINSERIGGRLCDECGDRINYDHGDDAEESKTDDTTQSTLLTDGGTDLFGITELEVGDELRVDYDTPRSPNMQSRVGEVAEIGEVTDEYAPTGTPEVRLERVRDCQDGSVRHDPIVLWPAWDEARRPGVGSLGDIESVERVNVDDEQTRFATDGGVQIPDDGESRFTEEDREEWEELAESPLAELSDAEITSKIRLSVKRRFDFPEWVLMFEYGAPGAEGSVCDCLAANTMPSRNYKVIGFEFKASRSDWLREVRDGQKADYFVRMADEFYVVAPKGVVEESEIPDGWGYLELKPNSEQLYKEQDSDLTEHQQGEPSRRFWVRFVKQTVGRQTNYTQEDLREARSRGYEEAKQEEMTAREIDRDLDRLKRKAENWEQLQDSEVGFISGYQFGEEEARTLELAYELVCAVRDDGYGSIRGDLERLQTRIERTHESFLESTEEIAGGLDTLVERIEDGADPSPGALEGGDGSDE